MKKVIFLIMVLAMPLLSEAQVAKQYYIYNIVNFEGKLKNEGFKVTVDNGKTIDKLRDENGKRIVFTTPAGALMYFTSKGWELYSHGSTTEGAVYNGIGGSDSSTYWILRKPCTKEEFDKAVNEAVKKEYFHNVGV